jgi:hypothetical protein
VSRVGIASPLNMVEYTSESPPRPTCGWTFVVRNPQAWYNELEPRTMGGQSDEY